MKVFTLKKFINLFKKYELFHIERFSIKVPKAVYADLRDSFDEIRDAVVGLLGLNKSGVLVVNSYYDRITYSIYDNNKNSKNQRIIAQLVFTISSRKLQSVSVHAENIDVIEKYDYRDPQRILKPLSIFKKHVLPKL